MSLTSGRQLLLSSAAAGSTQYQVSRSLRFNSADSAYLRRTPASAGNRKTWTWAGWIKRSTLGTIQQFFTCSTSGYSSSWSILAFNGDKLQLWFQNGSYPGLQTTAVYRDTGAWMHVLMNCDTTQATSANRGAIYVNGVKVTAFDLETYPSQNFDTDFNSTSAHDLGRQSSGGYYCDFMLADVYWIDGQALTPSSFTETDASTGQLIPKAFAGSYGTNGWHLEFADNSAATAAALGKDTSGNGNNWTPNNLSVTAGAGNDSLTDTPTSYGTDTGAGGEVRGNYCTLNPLNKNTNAASPTNGNLDYPYSSGAAAWLSIAATIGVTSGKYYWEITPTAVAGNGVIVGIANQNYNFAVAGSSTVYLGHTSNSWGYYSSDGKVYTNSAGTSYGNTFTANDVIGVALDMDNGKCWFSKNGTWQNSGSPTGGTNAAVTGLTGLTILPAVSLGDASPNTALTANFGQRAFAYTAPSGFKALVDTNLTAPVIAKSSTAFDVKLYTGNGSSQAITGLGFSPDLVWTKSRSGTYWHNLADSVRGAGKLLYSNSTVAEETNTGILTSFDSNGFTIGNDASSNLNGGSYVAWAWDAGTSTVTNNVGSINSQVRANTSAGFSVLTATTPTSGSSFSVGHGLGVAPAFAIFKDRGYANSWGIYHKSITTTTGGELLFTTAAAQNYGWFPSAPTSTTFTLSVGGWGTGASIVGYLWTPVAGYSSFGSYTGSAGNTFVYTGFRPRLVMIKRTDTAGSWYIIDALRPNYNNTSQYLLPNTSDGEYSDNIFDLLSNGFKFRLNAGGLDGSGGSYIYCAWAESPFQYARAR